MRVCVFVRPTLPPMPRLSEPLSPAWYFGDGSPREELCSCDDVGCLAKCQVSNSNPSCPAWGAGPWKFGWHVPPLIPGSDRGPRSVELCTGAPMTYAEGHKARGTVSVDRRAPQDDSHSLTQSFTLTSPTLQFLCSLPETFTILLQLFLNERLVDLVPAC